MTDQDREQEFTKPANWVSEFHSAIGYQSSARWLDWLVEKWQATPDGMSPRQVAKTTTKTKPLPDWAKVKGQFVKSIRGWEQTQNAYFNMMLRLLPSSVLKDVFNLHAANGLVELAGINREIAKKIGLGPNTLQLDSMLVSGDCVCMIEIKTKTRTHLSLQQIVKYLHGIAEIGQGRPLHRLLLVTPHRRQTQWETRDRPIMFRGNSQLPDNFTLAALGVSFDEVRRHFGSSDGKKNSATARRLMADHTERIEKQFHDTVIEWTDWSSLLERLQAAVESGPDGDARLMCKRLVDDFVNWKPRLDGKRTGCEG